MTANPLKWLLALIETLMARLYPPQPDFNDTVRSTEPPPAPISNITATTPTEPLVAPTEPIIDSTETMWDTPRRAYHSTRVIGDEMRLSVAEKNLICACIYQESQFNIHAVGKNKDTTDWGIVQVNDYWHIGKGKTFPSVEYVMANPEACVRWMILCYKQGALRLWVSYTSGAYKQWLATDSPMWLLK